MAHGSTVLALSGDVRRSSGRIGSSADRGTARAPRRHGRHNQGEPLRRARRCRRWWRRRGGGDARRFATRFAARIAARVAVTSLGAAIARPAWSTAPSAAADASTDATYRRRVAASTGRRRCGWRPMQSIARLGTLTRLAIARTRVGEQSEEAPSAVVTRIEIERAADRPAASASVGGEAEICAGSRGARRRSAQRWRCVRGEAPRPVNSLPICRSCGGGGRRPPARRDHRRRGRAAGAIAAGKVGVYFGSSAAPQLLVLVWCLRRPRRSLGRTLMAQRGGGAERGAAAVGDTCASSSSRCIRRSTSWRRLERVASRAPSSHSSASRPTRGSLAVRSAPTTLDAPPLLSNGSSESVVGRRARRRFRQFAAIGARLGRRRPLRPAAPALLAPAYRRRRRDDHRCVAKGSYSVEPTVSSTSSSFSFRRSCARPLHRPPHAARAVRHAPRAAAPAVGDGTTGGILSAVRAASSASRHATRPAAAARGRSAKLSCLTLDFLGLVADAIPHRRGAPPPSPSPADAQRRRLAVAGRGSPSRCTSWLSFGRKCSEPLPAELRQRAERAAADRRAAAAAGARPRGEGGGGGSSMKDVGRLRPGSTSLPATAASTPARVAECSMVDRLRARRSSTDPSRAEPRRCAPPQASPVHSNRHSRQRRRRRGGGGASLDEAEMSSCTMTQTASAPAHLRCVYRWIVRSPTTHRVEPQHIPEATARLHLDVVGKSRGSRAPDRYVRAARVRRARLRLLLVHHDAVSLLPRH